MFNASGRKYFLILKSSYLLMVIAKLSVFYFSFYVYEFHFLYFFHFFHHEIENMDQMLLFFSNRVEIISNDELVVVLQISLILNLLSILSSKTNINKSHYKLLFSKTKIHLFTSI
jgi:sterol desaturase/sphingolipid hydroxylase (fatty acid hydroxylase superfamily)